MKVNLAKSAGFCFGVKRAIDIAFQTAKPGIKVYMLGDIVHNEDVINKIQKLGVKKISKLSKNKGNILLIRAHGAGQNTYNKALKLGYKIVDATCPMVKEIHKIAKDMENKGYKTIIVGDKSHDEVKGIIGQLKNKAIIIDSAQNLDFNKLSKIKKAVLLSQSTQNTEKVEKIFSLIKPRIKDLKFFNTICKPTRIKQAEIKSLPFNNDIIIVIGSKTSANTRRLYELSKAFNPRTYWIRNKSELKTGWLKNVKRVGLTAGASTPEWITQEIVQYLSSC